MLEHERAEFVTAIAAMAATFRQEATEAVFEGYWIGLSDLNIEAVKQAVARAIRDCTFMPAAAELRRFAGVLTPADRAIKAWDAFCHGVRVHGYYQSVNFDDAVINATVRSLGGWMPLIERFETDESKWIRKDFERIYESFCRTGISREAAAPLIGWFDHDNLFNGYCKATDTFIRTGLPPHPAGIVPAITDERKPPRAIAVIENAVAAVGQPKP